MVNALFDTNILIDYLKGIDAARDELDRYRDKAISIVTWMEVMVGTTSATANTTRAFLDRFRHVQLDDAVAQHAVTLRRAHRIKLPDAIVWASAHLHSMLFVTRNTKDFPVDEPGVRIPYRI